MKKINVGDTVKIKVGVYANEIGKVTTILSTNRKRYYVTIHSDKIQCCFYRHISLVKNEN
jgi:transcription antitermination factor NusG